ncbi:hypothetical protein CVU37_10960 [candidate division BRC1 bacterium HGW-BRC1-1]|jgi:cytosine/adenosine deaminase-related metal-dependent hydrolase|nr:MAG: hypothetical protein CVU37_10960 [candidate division BRC1 bacterium HGW-BRC1-1]
MNPARRVIHAKAAWIDGEELARDIAVVIESGVITDLIRTSDHLDSPTESCDLLLPGFINAHCHLEYSWLKGRMPRGDNHSFPQWLEAINSLKVDGGGEDYFPAMDRALEEMIIGGTTCVVNSYVDAESMEKLRVTPLRAVALEEVLHLRGDAESALSGALGRSDEDTAEGLLARGLNPHAPYTVNGPMRAALRAVLAQRPNLLTAWHLAETAGEVEMFESGTGELMEFFQRNHIPLPFDQAPRAHPADFMNHEGLWDRCDAVFHWNHPGPEGSSHFAAPRAVVHCPGTHAFFDRPPFPMKEILADGANVCLGTDSLASSDSLSMLEMIRLTGESFPFLTGGELVNMVTRNPARSRLIASSGAKLGTISVGAEADLVLFSHPTEVFDEPTLRQALLARVSQVSSVFVAGDHIL